MFECVEIAVELEVAVARLPLGGYVFLEKLQCAVESCFLAGVYERHTGQYVRNCGKCKREIAEAFKFGALPRVEVVVRRHVHHIAVISLGGTVVSASIKIAGDDFDEALVRYMRKKHNLLIGERTAEDIKIKIGSAFKRPEVDYLDVRGRNLVTGLPKTVKVSSEETEEALKETTAQIIETIHSVLEKTPPELAADIADRGIVLTGGGSLLRGLEDLVAEKTGINTMTAEDPMTAVAIGTGKYVEFLAGYRED